MAFEVYANDQRKSYPDDLRSLKLPISIVQLKQSGVLLVNLNSIQHQCGNIDILVVDFSDFIITKSRITEDLRIEG